MYETFYGLADRPFAAVPQADRCYCSATVDAVQKTLARCLDRAEGVALLVGPTGVGKTLMCRALARQFGEQFDVVLLGGGRLNSRRSLLQAILFELGLPYRGMAEGELRLALLDHVGNSTACPTGVLLLVDDAHVLPPRLLDEMRMIADLGDGDPRVRLLLAGLQKLEERFSSSRLESLQQRIAARCYLTPFGYDETIDYVRWQLAAAGAKSPSLFHEDALAAVHHASGGVPRLVNQICDHALLLGCAAGRRRINAPLIEEAWADLQQLPAPQSHSRDVTESDSSADVIEFGQLDSVDEQIEWRDDDAVECVETHSLEPGRERNEALTHACNLIDDCTPDRAHASLDEPTAVDPFAEEFDSEEVVIAVDAMGGLADWSRLPLVANTDPRMAIALGYIPQTTFSTQVTLTVADDPAEGVSESACDPVFPEESLDGAWRTVPCAVRPQPSFGRADGVNGDAAMIVVEDDPAPQRIAVGDVAVAPVRRQEYGSLFARLRHG